MSNSFCYLSLSPARFTFSVTNNIQRVLCVSWPEFPPKTDRLALSCHDDDLDPYGRALTEILLQTTSH